MSRNDRTSPPTSRRVRGVALTALTIALAACAAVDSKKSPPDVLIAPLRDVEAQPFAAHTKRLVEALDFVGAPLSPRESEALQDAYELAGVEQVVAIQGILDRHVLVDVNINPESRVKVRRGPVAATLFQQGWRAFLVRVHNEAGVTGELQVKSPNAAPIFRKSTRSPEPEAKISAGDLAERWSDIRLFTGQPLGKTLSGLELEYRILEVFSRDTGKREAKFLFDVGQGTQDLGFRNEVSVLFECASSCKVLLDVRDFDGSPTTASFVVRDARGRLYPYPSRRLAPDFFFHPQVYRHTGEFVLLPAGAYDVEVRRGPEYLVEERRIEVAEGATEQTEAFQLRRWIHPRLSGWYSGDHHVHGGGCAHYEDPSAGVRPEDMMRHILGEDLNVGCVLSWGPCWYFQKQFFEGRVHDLSQKNYLMRYDVEVSGFPSSHAGHLCLLRLREDDYPGTTRIEEWPSWDLPVLKWGKSQGGVVGFSHSGWGLEVDTDELPNYIVPPFDSIGANEYIVDVVHDAVDFISTVDTPYVWELNIWYHTLNCGYRTRISGETDFPCIYGERVGLGRVYAKLDGKLDFDAYCTAIQEGRSYVGDGLSHILDFRAADRDLGDGGSQVEIAAGDRLRLTATVAARLEETPTPDLRDVHYSEKPYWHIERARIPGSRKVPLELIVNGKVVERREIVADGKQNDVRFDVQLKSSSWVALRILPSSHTNPFFVLVDGKPIRASRKSARWCLESVDKCWNQKLGRTRQDEREAAAAAYEVARQAYRRILEECPEGS